MNFESIDRINDLGEPSGPEEFEKLEFLPEESADSNHAIDDTDQIFFTPEDAGVDEPPISFSPDIDDDHGFNFAPAPEPDLGAPLPFELFGSSLFDDPDLDLDDDLDPLAHDDFDDLEF